MPLIEAPCYFCTRVIPAEALNCPNCGKERKELNDLRLEYRIYSGLPIVSGIIFVPLYFAHRLDLGAMTILSLGGFLCLYLANRARKRYANRSGKKMAGL